MRTIGNWLHDVALPALGGAGIAYGATKHDWLLLGISLLALTTRTLITIIEDRP